MRIGFLGNWSSNLIKGRRNVSILLNKDIVLDFGPHTIESLLERDIDPCGIQKVLITHMHLDHFAGIPELIWYRSIYKAENKLTIFGPKGIKRSILSLLKLLKTPKPWYTQISKGITYIEDKSTDEIEIFKGDHIIQDNGYRIYSDGKIIFYSGDTAYSKDIVRGARDADILLHEMTYTDEDEIWAKYWKHSTYSSVIKVFNESGSKKLIPVHLSVKSNELAIKLSKEIKYIIYPKDFIKV